MQLLRDSPLLVLFVVAAAGYLLGKIEVAGFSLGVAAVLFAGLALGAVDPRLALPEIIQAFGLVVFVYGIGISSGPTGSPLRSPLTCTYPTASQP